MNQLRISIVLLCTIFHNTSWAQSTVTIHGYVLDQSSNEHLIGATVYSISNNQGILSNNYGYYSLTLPKGKQQILTSYVGFEKQNITLELEHDTSLNFYLSPRILDEVVIETSKDDPILETTQMGTFNLTSKQIDARPVLMGETDVLKTLQLLPGVSGGREGSSGLYVRGGGPDQNLVLLDGIPVYNTSHIFGFLSTFNNDAIKDVKLIKGAFPARYGGRLSSVVDISLKEGNAKEFNGTGSVSFVASRLTLEAPIVKDKTSFIISARRSFLDLAMQPFIKPNTFTRENDQQPNNPTTVSEDPRRSIYFYDINAKINHKFSSKDRLYLSFYTAKDKGHNRNTIDEMRNGYTSHVDQNADIGWESTVGVLRWNHIIGKKLFSNLSMSYSAFDFQTKSEDFSLVEETISDATSRQTIYTSFSTTSNIEDWSAKWDFEYFPSLKHHIRFGASATTHSFVPNVTAVKEKQQADVQYHNEPLTSEEYYSYIEDNLTLSKKWKANVGLHASAFSTDNTTYTSLQPRLSINHQVNDDMAIKLSYSDMTQYLHLLTHPTVGFPTDFWVPVTDKVKPQQSQQISLGWYYKLPQRDLELSIEPYFKKMQNLIEYQEGSSFINHQVEWQDKITIGEGESYGSEFFVKHTLGKTSGWLGYTLAWSNRQFDELNGGKSFPYRYDRRHDVNLTVNHQLNKKVFLSANWVFASGSAITLPASKYIYLHDQTDRNEVRLEYSERNGYRMRPYHRLDLSARFYKKTKWGERNWIISIYNAYNRLNTFYIKKELDVSFQSGQETYKFKEYVLFPIIPSISYQFKF